MELKGFREYLKERKVESDKINKAIDLITEFHEFLFNNEKSLDNANYNNLHNFSAYLITNKKNSFENYVYLLRFAYFKKNNQLVHATMELLDGREMIENFSNRLIKEFGIKVRDEIFEGDKVPPLGLHPKKKPEITRKLIERFLKKFGPDECKKFLADGLRDKYTEDYIPAREKFLKINNIDDFLKDKHQQMMKTLKKHQKEGTLFFTQEVDEEVISYVENDPSIEAGIRKGNQVNITKIPYMTKHFLNETDEKKKMYYYCHCPWVREALIEEDQPIPPIFCHSSGGFYKNYWEAVLDQPVKVDLLESVIKGDKACKFTLYLPQEFADN